MNEYVDFTFVAIAAWGSVLLALRMWPRKHLQDAKSRF